jgi:hypothetical protein
MYDLTLQTFMGHIWKMCGNEITHSKMGCHLYCTCILLYFGFFISGLRTVLKNNISGIRPHKCFLPKFVFLLSLTFKNVFHCIWCIHD